jgi:hypothetical protein
MDDLWRLCRRSWPNYDIRSYEDAQLTAFEVSEFLAPCRMRSQNSTITALAPNNSFKPKPLRGSA